MSCVFVIAAPLVAANWASLSAIVGAVGAHLGYRLLEQESSAKNKQKISLKQERNVELTVKNSEVFSGQLRRGESMRFAKDAITLDVKLDAHGKLTVTVHGEGEFSEQELERIGNEFINQVVQRYVYQQVMEEMRDKGFSMVEEHVEEDGRIRIRVRKFE